MTSHDWSQFFFCLDLNLTTISTVQQGERRRANRLLSVVFLCLIDAIVVKENIQATSDVDENAWKKERKNLKRRDRRQCDSSFSVTPVNRIQKCAAVEYGSFAAKQPELAGVEWDLRVLLYWHFERHMKLPC